MLLIKVNLIPNFNNHNHIKMSTITTYDYKVQQVLNTNAEIKRMEEYAERISLDDMQLLLKEIGLKLDLNENSYALYYYNNYNEHYFYQMCTSPIDDKKISAYNINSDFYNKHLKGDSKFHSEMGRKLDKLRQDYFTTIVRRGIEYIISF